MADERTNTAAFLSAAAGALAAQAKSSARASVLTPDQTQDAAFGQGSVQGFSPGEPVAPDVERDVRLVDFPASINTNLTPRSNEPFGFPQLRAFSNTEIVRLAIETRKDQVETLDWSVKPRDPRKGEGKESPQAKQIEEFFQYPDGVNDFASWSRILLEDMLVLDAPSIELQRTNSGQLAGLLIVPGDTIHPMVDMRGRRPVGPDVAAYQQIIKGKIWANLTNDDLIYQPRNPRPGKIYGYSPVEQIIVTIQTVLARQTGQLAYFTDGNIPAGILTGPEGWTPSQLAEMQQAFNEQLKNNFSRTSNVQWVPFGTKFQEFKEAPLKNEFDEWLARIVLYAFNLPPTPFIKAMNRSTASNDSDRGKEEGLQPIKLWLKRILDRVIAREFGAPDLEFVWTDKAEVDAAKQAKVDDLYLRNGSITINEVRDRRGLQPVTGGDELLIYSPTGVTPLDVLLANPVLPGQPMTNGAPAAPGDKPKPKTDGSAQVGKPTANAANKLEKSASKLAPLTIARAKPRRYKAAIAQAATEALQKAGDFAAAEIERRVRAIHKVEASDQIDAKDNEADIRKKAEAIVALLSLADLIALRADMTTSIYELYLDTAKAAAEQAGVEVTSDVLQTFADAADAYSVERADELFTTSADSGAEAIRGIVPNDPTEGSLVDSTKGMVANEVAKAIVAGGAASAIGDAVQGAYAFSPERAAVIAHNEAQLANTAGALLGYAAAQAGGATMMKYWQTAEDELVEPTCLINQAAGAIPMTDQFPSGDTSTPAHPRCRCSIGIVLTAPTAPTAPTDPAS